LFGGASIEEIIRASERETGEAREFAHATLNALHKKSPISLKVTFEQLRRGAAYPSLKEALIVEYRLAIRFLAQPDLYEGIRAVIIDKDHAPKWQPSSVGEVSDASVEAFFAPLADGDLVLRDHWTQST